MVAKYFFPETTEQEMMALTKAEPNYVVWAFPFWNWMMKKDISITVYDSLDYQKWAKLGIEGLKQSVSPKEFDFYIQNTKNIDSLQSQITQTISNPLFTLHTRKPAMSDLQHAFERGAVCEVVLDSCTLDEKPGFILHRVVVLDVKPDYVIVHDPRTNPTEKNMARKIPLKHFVKSWLEAVNEPELCISERKTNVIM
jgi:hypothetical protein